MTLSWPAKHSKKLKTAYKQLISQSKRALKSLLIILSHYSNHINLSSSTLLLIPERTYLNPRLTSISSSNFNLTLKLILNPSHNPPFRRFTTIINLSFFSLHLCILLIIAHIYILITINFNKILGEPHL